MSSFTVLKSLREVGCFSQAKITKCFQSPLGKSITIWKAQAQRTLNFDFVHTVSVINKPNFRW